MASTARVLEKKDSSLMFRQITPPHGWKQDSDFHYLRLTLPGFEAKDITIRMDKYGHLVVRGDKQVTEHKYITFEETFNVPNDANLEEAEGRFENHQIYCISIPKNSEEQRRGHAPPTIPPKGEAGESSRHEIFMPGEKTPEGSSRRHRIANNPLEDIKRDKSKKMKIVFSVALVIALFAVAVVLIVKFHRR